MKRVIPSKTMVHSIQEYATLHDMRNMIETLKKSRKQFYTLSDIEAMKIMPWARNYRTLRRILDADISGPNLLQVQVTSDANQRRYTVPKRALIKYLQTHGPSLMTLVRKPKQYGNTRNKRKN